MRGALLGCQVPLTTPFPPYLVAHCSSPLVLTAREQEVRQGWLYNYIVMLDDDLEASSDFAAGVELKSFTQSPHAAG